MSPRARSGFTVVGVFGHMARSVIFLLIGYGGVKAAMDYSPAKAIGLDGALRNLQHSTGGPLVLGVVALGFIAFGIYSIADARYHRV